MSQFWNKKTQALVPYVPGEQPQDRKYIKLNTNENPYPPSPKVIEAIKSAADDGLRLYPDPEGRKLVNAIAARYNVKAENVFLGNGSDEILAFCFLAYFESKPILFPDITYSFYPVYAQIFSIDYKLVPLENDFSIPIQPFLVDNGGIIFPNPNAPTGRYMELGNIESIIQANQNSVVIIDEAYVDFGGQSAVNLTNKYKNLLVVKTLSKSRSLAGLRTGYAIGDAALIEGLNRVKNSFNSYTIDRLAIVGATAAIEDENYFEETCNKVIKTREWVIEELLKLGFSVVPSAANFIFATHLKLPAVKIFAYLREQGILVRYFNKPRIDNYLRISIGTDAEMKEMIRILALHDELYKV